MRKQTTYNVSAMTGRPCLSWVLTAIIGLLALPAANAVPIEVTTTAPSPGVDGACTLGEAVDAANTDSAVGNCPAGSGADIIFLAARTFTLALPYIAGSNNALIEITSDVTLAAAPGPVGTAVIERDAAAGLFRIFQVGSSGTLRLNRITVSGGRVNGPGAGILVDAGATLYLENSAVSGNEALGDDGGGISNDGGTVNITKSSVNNNTAVNGGGISSSGELVISASTLSGNVANGNGGALSNEGGSVAISNQTTVSSNEATGDGGGIDNDGTMTVSESTVTENTAGANGGGVSDSGSETTITASTISKNEAGVNGGGIHNSGGPMTFIGGTLSRNEAAAGGGIFNASGSVAVSKSAITDNSADNNGGGVNNNASFEAVNSTLGGNRGTDSGGALFSGPNAVSNSFISSTISTNNAAAGGGIFVAAAGSAELLNTVLAKNTAGAGADCNGNVVSQDYNLIEDPALPCGVILAANDLTGPAALDSFSDNGESGNGHFSPTAVSPALEGGNDGACTSNDQIGQPRVDVCEIGAIESQEQITEAGEINLLSARFNMFYDGVNFNVDSFFFRLLLSKSPIEVFEQPFDKKVTIDMDFVIDGQIQTAYQIVIPANTLPGVEPRSGRPYTKYQFSGPPPVRKVVIEPPRTITVEMRVEVERTELLNQFRSQLDPQVYFDTVLSKITDSIITVQLGEVVWSATAPIVVIGNTGRRISISWDH